MSVLRTLALAFLVAVVSVLTLARPSFAAVQNDDRESATVIAPVPLWDTVDTLEATTSDLERSYCGSMSNGVWYKYPAPSVDTQLTYLIQNVVDGEGNLTDPLIAFILDDGSSQCGPGVMDRYQNVWSNVPAGVNAYILIGNGYNGRPGLVQLGVFMAEPIDHFSVAISEKAYVDASGTLTASGTIGCERVDSAYLNVRVKQRSGHGYITGEAPLQGMQCDTPSSAWSMAIAPTAGGRFVAGKATVSAEVICPVTAACAGARVEDSVKVAISRR